MDERIVVTGQDAEVIIIDRQVWKQHVYDGGDTSCCWLSQHRMKLSQKLLPQLLSQLMDGKQRVPLARVLEIVEERVNMWGVMLSDARTGLPAMAHDEAETILRRLRDEFEEE